MKLAQRHVQGGLLLTHLLQAMQSKIDAFADADAGGSDEAEGVCFQRVAEAELLLQALILL
jgi:hypothetical protein